MIDVNKITSTLAKLSDVQLQTYAKMNPDPYTIALAVAESNRRKELRAAGQGAMQEQPKVVDQMVAEMAPQQMPEEMGIGQLNAGEMNFAGGGIVAFADGGDVERYSGAQGSLIGGIAPALMAQYDRETQEMGFGQRMQFSPEVRAVVGQIQAAKQAEFLKGEQAKMLQAPALRGQRMMADTGTPPVATPTPAAPAADNLSGMDRRLMAGSQPNIPSFRTPLPPKAEDKGRGKTDRGAPTDKAAAPAATAAVDPFSMQAIREAQEQAMRDVNYQRGALRNEAVGLSNLYQQQGEDRLARRKKEIEEEGDIFKGREARLNAREADIGRQRNENKGLAFLNAGLAIMSTRGGLATALGQGAQVGTAQYASGLKDLRAAQQRLDDARDNIEELRLNRKDMNKKDIRALEKERDDNINKGKELLFGVAKETYGADEKSATALFNAYTQGQKTVYEQGQENKRNERRVQGMLAGRGDTAGTKQSQVAITALKAQATNLTNQLKDIPAVGTNNLARRQPLEAQLALINAQLAQLSGLGTMLPASPTGAGSGLDLSQWGKSQVVNP